MPLISDKDVEHWFTYHKPTEDQLPKYEAIRTAGKALAEAIRQNCPDSADRSAAIRKVREAVMTANASVACGGR
jgi:Xaa-Pro aminopeptidase